MNLNPEWIAMGVLALGCIGLALMLRRQNRKLETVMDSQRTLIQQLDGTHRVQLAYAEATEDAMTHLRDGLQTLTTVSANLDMKTYALELQQGRMGQRIKHQEKARQKAAIPAVMPIPDAVKKPATAAHSEKKDPEAKVASMSAAERELIAAVHTRQSRVA